MTLKADHSKMQQGNPPDETPRFGPLLAKAWAELDVDDHVKSRTDVEHYVRLGWGGACSRLLSYRLTDVPESDPTTLSGYWRMNLGKLVHEELQAALQLVFPKASIEHLVGADHDEIFGFPVSGRTDVFLVEDDRKIAIEVKTVNGFGYKKMVGARGVPEGPRTSAIYQAALNGRALDADEVVVVMLSLECLGQREADKLGFDDIGKFCSEWTWSMADLNEMVDRELVRLKRVVELADEGTLAPRFAPLEMPGGARVQDPATGVWTLERGGSVLETGTYWGCSYCSHQQQCVSDGA